MTPREALDALIFQGAMNPGMRRRPGEMVERAPAHVRAALKKLTSDDAADVRRDDPALGARDDPPVSLERLRRLRSSSFRSRARGGTGLHRRDARRIKRVFPDEQDVQEHFQA